MPKSPFNVQIFKTLADLEAFLASNLVEQAILKDREESYSNNETFQTIASAKTTASVRTATDSHSANRNDTIESLL